MPFILPVLTWTSKPLGSRGSVGACGSLCHRPALICLGSTKVSTADEDSTDNALTGSAMLERLRCCHRDLFAGHRANPPSPSTFQAVPVLPAPSDQPWGAPARFGRRSVLNSGKSSVQFLSHFQTLRATGSSPVEALPGSGCGDAALFTSSRGTPVPSQRVFIQLWAAEESKNHQERLQPAFLKS